MNSRRVVPLPPDWRHIRLRILDRDGRRCQWPTRHGICGQPATDVDHIVPAHLGGTEDDANLRSLCGPHHRTKTSSEAARARITRRSRTAEPHPGLRPGDHPPRPGTYGTAGYSASQQAC